ncbi:CaiB/BaiF CoA transferase family protein [uncultured Jatrophihabitans sp.]|uniref:CaiB/BaiF CoA transferase family protein n=1 Tax=uncultured Jatrophihabitans sp. TaxID=1610747 RepID=UPI0035CB365F
MPGPLEGVRIVELPAIGPVPFAGMLLADLGAEVVRIDKLAGARPGLGDALVSGPLGRGRRSITLDIRRPEGAEALLRLCESADALIEGFRPGVAERLGVGPEQVLARNPKLVYGRMTGWGQDGPLARTAGHDLTYLALTGLLAGIGRAGEPPVPPVNYIADFGGGAMFLVTGLLAALLHARATGEGQVIDTAMVDGAAYLGSMTRAFLATGGWQDRPESNFLDGGSPNYRCYTCADGKYLAVGAIEPQFWAGLCTAINQDPATAPSPYDPAQFAACTALLEQTFAGRSRDEWAKLFEALDACVAPVLTLEEALAHPHNVERGTYVKIGDVDMPGPAPRFSATPGRAGELVGVGDDTVQLLREAGYSAADIDGLRTAAVI